MKLRKQNDWFYGIEKLIFKRKQFRKMSISKVFGKKLIDQYAKRISIPWREEEEDDKDLLSNFSSKIK